MGSTRPTRHPWLATRLAPVEGLGDTVRLLSLVAGHTAKGDLGRLRFDWSFLPTEEHAGGLEIILQTHLFAGYPRTINALATVRATGVEVATPDDTPAASWPVDGEAACRLIYGPAYAPLRAKVRALHPALDRWMVEIGYGRVLSRPGPTLRERELCVLAVLAGQNVAPQLRSHLHGARRAGASWAECRGILDQTALVWGEAAQAEVDQLWAELKR